MSGYCQSTLPWLAVELAANLNMDAGTIDPKIPLIQLGVDSILAIGFVGDVEAHFDICLDLTMIYDNPTLESIAEVIDAAVADRELVAA